MKVSKTYDWVMGHRLMSNQGECVNPHGHNYVAEVEIEGQLNLEGMVLDFKDIDAIVKPIWGRLDHSFMVYQKDQELVSVLSGRGWKTTEVDFESTAENIARYLFDLVRASGINVSKIKVWETPKCAATYEGK